MIAPAFSKTFSITEQQRRAAGACIVIGDWAVALRALDAGRRDILAIPPGESGRYFDWSMLRNCNALILVYECTNAAVLIAQLRSYGVLDIVLLDYSARPPLMVLAPTASTLVNAPTLRKVAYG